MNKQVILLNGPSSCGKSTLARALQALIFEKRGERFEIVSIDDFLNMTAQDVVYEDDVFEISQGLCNAAGEAAQTGGGVIVDHVITSKRIFDHLTKALRPCRLRLIRVTCPLEVLKAREAARGDRCPGSAEASCAFLYPQDGYDLTVDTHSMTAVECAEHIFSRCFYEDQEEQMNRSPFTENMIL